MTRVSPKRSPGRQSPKSPDPTSCLQDLEKIIRKKNSLMKKKHGGKDNKELRHMAVLQASKQRLCKDIFQMIGGEMMWELVELGPFDKMDFGDFSSENSNIGSSDMDRINNNYSSTPVQVDGCSICDSSRCMDANKHKVPMTWQSSAERKMEEDDDPLQLNDFFHQLKHVPVSS